MGKEKFETLKAMYEDLLDSNRDVIVTSSVYEDKEEQTKDLIRRWIFMVVYLNTLQFSITSLNIMI